MDDSPIDQLLSALDRLDVDAAMRLAAPDCQLLTVDGHRSQGHEAVRRHLTEFLGVLRSTTHHVTAQWHVDDVWVAEAEASYELQDWLLMENLPRAFVMREGPDGFVELHVYGARERPLADHFTGEEGTRVGERWIPPL
jgi:hypothetical protein